MKYERMSLTHGNLWLIEKMYNWFRISPPKFSFQHQFFSMKEKWKVFLFLLHTFECKIPVNIELKCIGYSKIIWEIIFIILSIFSSRRLICLVWQKRPLLTSTILSISQWYTFMLLPPLNKNKTAQYIQIGKITCVGACRI